MARASLIKSDPTASYIRLWLQQQQQQQDNLDAVISRLLFDKPNNML